MSQLRFLLLFVALSARVAIALPAGILAVTGLASYGYFWQRPTCSSCCHLLQFALPGKVFFAADDDYKQTISSYWSFQEQSVIPGCVVQPTCTRDVEVAVNILTASGTSTNAGCKFAVKGAGHTPWAGSANIENGVTIDLGLMNSVVLSKNRKVTSIGPGARWADVYAKLDPLGLTVVGGRVSNVGVAGLTTGGGLSFFSSQHGFTCDNVVNFEVVLGNGSCVSANAHENTDLFWALKGGSNNFGIVTRFDVNTFELPGGKMWGGLVALPIQTTPQNVAALVKFNNASTDPHAAIINTYGYMSAVGIDYIVNSYEYTNATESFSPAAFSDFLGIGPQLFTTMRLSNLSDFTAELDSRAPNGFKQIFETSTYANNASLLEKIVDISTAAYQPIKTVGNLTWSISFQPLSTAITSKSAAMGGNALGLSPSDGNLIISLLGVTWSNPADDAAITAAVQKYMADADSFAASVGGLHHYKYLNYAGKNQDPIIGYGSKSKNKLQRVSKKYDPRGVFQKQVPGGFKLFK